MSDQLCDRRVSRALTEVAAGQISGMGDLVELIGGSVYRVSRALTGNDIEAEDAAVETFRQIWQRVPHRIPEGAAISWTLRIACEVACELRSAKPVQQATSGGAAAQNG